MCSSSVHTFLVFDAFSMKPDGSDPVVFYSYPQSGQSQHFAVNQAGLLITFVKFCKRFRPTRDCDYILTRSRETALLELSDEIWISVSRDVVDAPGRYYLISILQTYRRIYELFFEKPVRDKVTKVVLPRMRRRLADAFDMIIRGVNNAPSRERIVDYLYNSFYHFELDPMFLCKLSIKVNELFRKCPLEHLAIVYSNHHLFSTFPSDVFKTLLLAIRMKLGYLFPAPRSGQTRGWRWMIGLSYEGDVLNVYAPPIRINGKPYPLIMLKQDKIKIIVALKGEVPLLPVDMFNLVEELDVVMKFFGIDRFKETTVKGTAKGRYLCLKNEPKKSTLSISKYKVSDQLVDDLAMAVMRANYYMRNYVHVSTLAFPLKQEMYLLYATSDADETISIVKPKSMKLTQAVATSAQLEQPGAKQRAEITMVEEDV